MKMTILRWHSFFFIIVLESPYFTQWSRQSHSLTRPSIKRKVLTSTFPMVGRQIAIWRASKLNAIRGETGFASDANMARELRRFANRSACSFRVTDSASRSIAFYEKAGYAPRAREEPWLSNFPAGRLHLLSYPSHIFHGNPKFLSSIFYNFFVLIFFLLFLSLIRNCNCNHKYRWVFCQLISLQLWLF